MAIIQNLDETIFDNEKLANGIPAMTIASPYFHDDPTVWMAALKDHPLAHRCEVIVVDDGTGDEKLDKRVSDMAALWPGPAQVVRFHANKGRSAARNRAIAGARGDYVLFVDADMLPSDDQFLDRYLDVIDSGRAAFAFGGFTTVGGNINHDTELHHSLSEQGDCKPALERSMRGAYAVASNNLLVRRDVLEVHGFDDSFTGWGWEDTEWAVRALDDGYGLLHIDNPAVHVSLDTSKTMLKKYREAAPNLERMLTKHPFLRSQRGAIIAGILRFVPFHPFFRPMAAQLAEDKEEKLSVDVRRLAIKYWRASWAADALAGKAMAKLGEAGR